MTWADEHLAEVDAARARYDARAAHAQAGPAAPPGFPEVYPQQ